MATYTDALISLLPVIVGGAVGVIGSLCGSAALEVLSTRREEKIHKRHQLEKVSSLVYEARYWIQINSVAEMFDLERDKRKIPTADMRTISLLCWPQLKQEVSDLNNYIISYQTWAMEQGALRKQQGSLGPAVALEHQNRSTKVRELIGKLEEKARAINASLNTR